MSARLVSADGAWRVDVGDRHLHLGLPTGATADGDALARAICSGVAVAGPVLTSGCEISAGMWPLKVLTDPSGDLVLGERVARDTDWVAGLTQASALWAAQRQVAAQWQVPFAPPGATQLVAVSKGVEAGDPLEGVRHVAPDHMAGWYLTTEAYDGDPASLHLVHAWHLADRRKDVAAFLALPPGCFFRKPAHGPVQVGRAG